MGKTFRRRLLIAIVVALLVGGLVVFGRYAEYFLTILPTTGIKEGIVLAKIMLIGGGTAYWLLYMSYRVKPNRENMQRLLLLILQYGLAIFLFWNFSNFIEEGYIYTYIVTTLENTRYLLKYGIAVAICLQLVTDYRRWDETWKSHVEAARAVKTWLASLRKHGTGKIRNAISGRMFQLWERNRSVCEKHQNLLLVIETLVVSFIITETYLMNEFYQVSIKYILCNLGIFALIYIINWAITRRWKLASVFTILVATIIGMGNYFVILFRGNPINYGDLFVIKTALSVSGSYQYTINHYFVLATAVAIGSLVLIILTKEEKRTITKKNYIGCLLSCVLLVGICSGFLIKTGVLYRVIDSCSWNPNIQAHTNGYMLSFMADTVQTMIQEPEGYDVLNLQALLCTYQDEMGDTKQEKDVQENTTVEPNIIVIMNESFSDLSVLGALETEPYYMPYVKSLTENTMYGNMYVSAYGGSTVYTEYEFLTGNSMGFIPPGMIPYVSYIKEQETPSLAKVLKNQKTSYETVAIHPYEKAGYNRAVAYQSFGFDDFISQDDFDEYTIIRKFMSDRDDYKKVIEVFEEKEEGTPLFVFNVTMQNHGGYGERQDYVFEEPVKVTNREVDYSVEEYLSCIKSSDTAFQELIHYFEQQKEPTIILMYGDHQPQFASDFYDMMFEKDSTALTQDEELLKHIVPFVMWSNYQDFGGEYVEAISPNFLASVLLEKAGLQLTLFEQYLLDVKKEFPVMTIAGCQRSDGTWCNLEDEIEQNETLKTYRSLQYNYLFGGNERLNKEFMLSN